jgi:hypothetical protein
MSMIFIASSFRFDPERNDRAPVAPGDSTVSIRRSDPHDPADRARPVCSNYSSIWGLSKLRPDRVNQEMFFRTFR